MSQDGTRVWDARTGRALLVVPPTAGPGYTAAWSPDGRSVLTEGLGPTVWDAETGRRVRDLVTGQFNLGLAFSPDGSRLAIGVATDALPSPRCGRREVSSA